MPNTPIKKPPRTRRRFLDALRKKHTEPKAEKKKLTLEEHQKKHETKQEAHEVEKKWLFKPKKDQKISKAKVSLDDSSAIAEITKDDLWYFYQQFFLGALVPSVQLKYNESFLDMGEKNPTAKVLGIMREFLSTLKILIGGHYKHRHFDVFDEYIGKNYTSPEEFFNKFFDICADFFPLDERFALFFKEMVGAAFRLEKSSYNISVLFHCVLDGLASLPDPFVVFKNADSMFLNSKITPSVDPEIYKEFKEECKKVLLSLGSAKKIEGKRELGDKKLQNKMKVFGESRFFEHSLSEKSFYERTKELLRIALSMSDLSQLESFWSDLRKKLLKNGKIKIVSFGEKYDASKILIPWHISQILQEKDTLYDYKEMNDCASKDPDLLKYFVFLIFTNSFFYISDNELKSFFANLGEQDRARIANIKIKLVEGEHSMLLPLPVFLCLYRERYYDLFSPEKVMSLFGLDIFNVKFKFDGKEHDIISFLKEIKDLHPKKEDCEHLPVQEREFNLLFYDAAKLHNRLKTAKEELELQANKKQTEISSDQPQKPDKVPSTKIESANPRGIFRGLLNKKTEKEKTRPDNTTNPDTKVHMIELDRPSRNDGEIVSII